MRASIEARLRPDLVAARDPALRRLQPRRHLCRHAGDGGGLLGAAPGHPEPQPEEPRDHRRTSTGSWSSPRATSWCRTPATTSRPRTGLSKLVAAWLASGRRAKAIHSARRRLDEAGGLHEVIDDGPRILAGMTPLEVIRDHGTLVGATLGWDRDLWRVFGPLGATPIFDDFPTAFRASLIGEIAYLAGAAAALPDGRHLVAAAGRLRPQLPLRLPHQGPALAPLVLAGLPRGDGGRRAARRRGVPAALRGEDRRGRLRDRPRRDPLVAAAAAAARGRWR